MFVTHSMAFSLVSTWMTVKPGISSFASRKGPSVIETLPSVRMDPGLLGMKPAAGDEDSLLDGLLHELPQLGRVPRLLPLRWGTVDKELHVLLLSRLSGSYSA